MTFLSNCSPVLPSQRDVCPEEGRSANLSNSVTSLTDAPSKTGVEIGTPEDKLIDSSSNSLSFNGFIFSSKTFSP